MAAQGSEARLWGLVALQPNKNMHIIQSLFTKHSCKTEGVTILTQDVKDATGYLEDNEQE